VFGRELLDSVLFSFLKLFRFSSFERLQIEEMKMSSFDDFEQDYSMMRKGLERLTAARVDLVSPWRCSKVTPDLTGSMFDVRSHGGTRTLILRLLEDFSSLPKGTHRPVIFGFFQPFLCRGSFFILGPLRPAFGCVLLPGLYLSSISDPLTGLLSPDSVTMRRRSL
jgi:hypothetical protein